MKTRLLPALALALGLLALPGFAFAQGTGCTNVTQNGLANQNDPAKFQGNCQISSGLGSAGNAQFPPTGLQSSQGLSRVDILNGNYGLNLFDAPNSGAYHSWQFGFVGGVPTMSLGAFGGATLPNYFNLVINGITTQIPGSNPPPPQNWYAQLHESTAGGLAASAGAGTAFGPTGAALHQVLFADQNVPLNADIVYWGSRDASMQVQLNVTTPTSGDTAGITWTVGSSTYTATVSVTGGETAQQVATAICQAINNNSGLTSALKTFSVAASGSFVSDGIGYIPYQTSCANQTSGGVTTFDQPFGTTITPVNGSGGTTITLHGPGNTGSPALDGNPTFVMGRWVPGYSPLGGELLGQIIFQGPFTSANNFVQTGAITNTLVGPSQSKLGFNTAPTSAGAVISMELSKGLLILPGQCGNAGTFATSDKGQGTIAAPCGVFTQAVSVSSAATGVTSISLANTSAGGAAWNIQTPGSGTSGRTGNLEILAGGQGMAMNSSGQVQVAAANCTVPYQPSTGLEVCIQGIKDYGTFLGLGAGTLTYDAGASGTASWTLNNTHSGNASGAIVFQGSAANKFTLLNDTSHNNTQTFGLFDNVTNSGQYVWQSDSADNFSVPNGAVKVGAPTGTCNAGDVCVHGSATLRIDGVSGIGGTVTSVIVTAPNIFTLSGCTITTSGTCAITLATQSANTVFAGPGSGGALAPTFRALVAADIPTTGLTLASPALSGTVTGSNTIPLTILAQAAGGTVLGNATSGTANVTATSTPLLGIPSSATGTLSFANSGSAFQLTLSPASAAASRTITIPDPGANDTLVALAATQTLTNKTLTSPTITGPTIGVPSSSTGSLVLANSANANTMTLQTASIATSSRTITFPDPGANDSVVFLAATQTLTNKTLSGGTISGTIAGTPTFSGATVTFTNNIVTTSGVIQSPLTTWADNQSCTAGQFVMDTGFLYVCTGLGGTSNVKRVALATF